MSTLHVGSLGCLADWRGTTRRSGLGRKLSCRGCWRSMKCKAVRLAGKSEVCGCFAVAGVLSLVGASVALFARVVAGCVLWNARVVAGYVPWTADVVETLRGTGNGNASGGVCSYKSEKVSVARVWCCDVSL